ncbi:CheR family methyltransferase [Halobacteriovorax marinus]|uniref:CheR family methyltransferase n=1 Tax=Halobacteriovorax marinus TaxID=97084 RepID=UPI003A9127A2
MMSLPIEDLTDSNLKSVISFVHSATGITIPEHKKTMIQRRLSPRLKFHSLTSYSDYLKLVKSDSEEMVQFINMVTTNETNFFRTERVWEYFECTFLPSFLEMNPGKTLKVWSAAASTGEEGYSIGMCCEDFKKRQSTSFDYSVLGTDISSRVIELATSGRYSGRNIDNIKKKSIDRFNRFFNQVGDQHIVSSILRSKVSFATHNLFNTLKSDELFDIVFLRNVLIYFSTEDQKKVIHHLIKKMAPGAILVVGESESLSNLNTELEFISPLIYRKRV